MFLRRRFRRACRGRSAFTLVELLVVIGIIAVLIGILMPALSAARRQSMQTKCLASLREIGNGFASYAVANKGYWPCAVHDGPGTLRYPLPFGRQLRWQDRILPYITNINTVDSYADLSNPAKVPPELLRSSSVLWGCPAYRLADGSSVTTAKDDAVRNGYSMSCYPMLPDVAQPSNSDWAYIEGPGNSPFQFSNPAKHFGINGRYFKASEWKQASDRLLLDEGFAYYISMSPECRPPNVINPDVHKWWPFEDTTILNASTNQWENNTHFWIDGARHAPPGVTKKQSWNRAFSNALFCDGHAQPVSVREAWQAITNPGGKSAPSW